MKLHNFIVIVGNLGSVYDDWNTKEDKAKEIFDRYVYQSNNATGRVAGENVVMLKDGEIYCEHIGYNEAE